MKPDYDQHDRRPGEAFSKGDDLISCPQLRPAKPDGATREAARRPRGRPPGSKNKPKSPTVITREPDSVMRTHVLEVPGGKDVAYAVADYAHKKGIGLCVLAGTGALANVTLRQPGSSRGPTVTFHGRFDILSISATFLPPGSSVAGGSGFAVSLAGNQGQIIGGTVAGPLIAVGTVVVVAAVFSNPTYHHLPLEEEVPGVGAGVALSPLDTSGQEAQAQAQAETCGMPSIFSCNLPTDVVWPTAIRPPHPPF